MTKATSEMTNEEFSDYIASLFYVSDNTGHEDTATIDELEEILGMYTTDPECRRLRSSEDRIMVTEVLLSFGRTSLR